jgi:hypothetical protein
MLCNQRVKRVSPRLRCVPVTPAPLSASLPDPYIVNTPDVARIIKGVGKDRTLDGFGGPAVVVEKFLACRGCEVDTGHRITNAGCQSGRHP